MVCRFRHFNIQRAGQDCVPAGANVSLSEHCQKRQQLYHENHHHHASSWTDISYIKQNESYVLTKITLMNYTGSSGCCSHWVMSITQIHNQYLPVHTCYAFLQAFIEGTGTDLQQQRRWEPMERFDFSQSGQYNVNILSRALRRPAQKEKWTLETESHLSRRELLNLESL